MGSTPLDFKLLTSFSSDNVVSSQSRSATLYKSSGLSDDTRAVLHSPHVADVSACTFVISAYLSSILMRDTISVADSYR
jgi:hypothetical protein